LRASGRFSVIVPTPSSESDQVTSCDVDEAASITTL
jgi:hypothetical protein